MPEGHVIHRLAAEIEAGLGGRRVSVTSPQGRFAAASELLDGSVLTGAEAYGKNLFLDFDSWLVHVHLGLIGKLRWVAPDVIVAPDTVRLRIQADGRALELRGPQTCALLAPDELRRVVAGLGPDPLRPDADPDVGWQRVRRSNRSIASLLLDQRVAAGVGNIYRAEVLFRQRLHPDLPGRELSARKWAQVWGDLVELMPQGVRDGRIDTVRPEHSPEAQGRAPRVDRHGGEVYVYRRAGDECLVCGRAVSVRSFEGRNLYWCGKCQRRR